MAHPTFLTEAVVLFATAVVVALLLRRIRVPAIIGYLLTGMAIGPSGWQLIATERVGQFAELGLVLLLFTVGLELSPGPLLSTGRQLLKAVLLQFVFCILIAAAFLWPAGIAHGASLLILCLGITLSSTAIVLKSLADRDESATTSGVVATGILLLQDVVVIGFMLVLPFLAGSSHRDLRQVLSLEVASLVGLVVIVVGARWLLPKILNLIAQHGGRELITLFAVLMACLGAWLAGLAHWSLGLGACIAGLLLADVDQRHQLVAEITPFRDVFNALFFISLGMLVQMSTIVEHGLLLAAAVIATVVLKSAATAAAVAIAGWPWRIAIICGVSLCTVSEFGYVLAFEAQKYGLLSKEMFELVTAYVVGTMLLGTVVLPLARPLARALHSTGREGGVASEGLSHHATASQHVVIVGFGVTGSNLAAVLKSTNIPFVVIEMNRQLVAQARAKGYNVVVGDATRMSILAHADLAAARAIVVAINDPPAVESIVAQASSRYPDLYTVVRTPYTEGMEQLQKKGAKLVVSEDFETSIEIAAHVLKEFRVPSNIIDAQIASLRAGGYAFLRGRPADRVMTEELLRILQQTVTETYYLETEAIACGHTLASLNLRAKSGASVIAVVRNGKPTASPPPQFELAAGDVLVLVGAHEQLDKARTVLQHG